VVILNGWMREKFSICEKRAFFGLFHGGCFGRAIARLLGVGMKKIPFYIIYIMQLF